ncbi:MAG TPA: hypothetical protein VKA46_41470 [Gemmataceae bacterium]|nr:hypothetical protein [Gemmataceae bacterium]
MGQERVVTFTGRGVPAWHSVAELLMRSGFPVQMGMIDGQLSFPDEQPPPSWAEVRVVTPQGMVTVRREPDRVRLVTWGNADTALLQAWNALAWAFAEAGGGRVEETEGALSADDFRRRVDLPSVLRGGL